MIRGIEAILLNTADPKKLAKFYEDVVGLKVKSEWEGEDGETAFEMETGNVALYINSHSEVKGKNKEPQRIFVNFEVNDIEKEVARLKKEKVKITQDVYHVEGYGLIATCEDPDGNYFQLVQIRPTES